MKATKEKLIECLNKIGWTVRSHGQFYLGIYNHKNKFSEWVIVGDEKVEIEDVSGSFDESPTCSFYFSKCFLQWLPSVGKRKTTICLTAKGTQKSVFLFFANYDKTPSITKPIKGDV